MSCSPLLIKSLALYSFLNSHSVCWCGCLLIQELLNQAKNIFKFTQHFFLKSPFRCFGQFRVVICYKTMTPAWDVFIPITREQISLQSKQNTSTNANNRAFSVIFICCWAWLSLRPNASHFSFSSDPREE